jgi:hypothetical protein
MCVGQAVETADTAEQFSKRAHPLKHYKRLQPLQLKMDLFYITTMTQSPSVLQQLGTSAEALGGSVSGRWAGGWASVGAWMGVMGQTYTNRNILATQLSSRELPSQAARLHTVSKRIAARLPALPCMLLQLQLYTATNYIIPEHQT